MTKSRTENRGVRIPERVIANRPSGVRPRASEKALTRATERGEDARQRALEEARTLTQAVDVAESAFTKSQTSHDEQETIAAERAMENAKLKAVGFLSANEERIRGVAKDQWDEWVMLYGPDMEELRPVLRVAEDRYHTLLERKAGARGGFDEKEERQLELLVDCMVGLGNEARLGNAEVAASRERRKRPIDPQEALKFLSGDASKATRAA